MLNKTKSLSDAILRVFLYGNYRYYISFCCPFMLFVLVCFSWICNAQVMDGSALRDMLLERMLSMESIECEYVYHATFKGVTYPPETFVFRNKGDWIWYEMRRDTKRYTYEEGWSAFESETNINGTIDAFWIKQTGRKIHHAGLKRFNFLHYNILSPLTIVGRSSRYSSASHIKETLRDLLGTARLAYLEQGEPLTRLYLFHLPLDGNYRPVETGFGVIVHLDNTLTMHKVDYIMRPLCPFEETAIYAPEKPPHTLYRLHTTDYFSDYLSIDGFSIPMKIKRIYWERNYSPEQLEQRKEIFRLEETGMMGSCETEVRSILVCSDYIEKNVYELHIRPETCRINNPSLTREDFVVAPGDVNIYWDHVSGDYVNEDGPGNWYRLKAEQEKRDLQRYQVPFYRREGNLVLLMSAILVMGSLSLLFSVYIIRKRR